MAPSPGGIGALSQPQGQGELAAGASSIRQAMTLLEGQLQIYQSQPDAYDAIVKALQALSKVFKTDASTNQLDAAGLRDLIAQASRAAPVPGMPAGPSPNPQQQQMMASPQ
jgi:hypothetical protein